MRIDHANSIIGHLSNRTDDVIQPFFVMLIFVEFGYLWNVAYCFHPKLDNEFGLCIFADVELGLKCGVSVLNVEQ